MSIIVPYTVMALKINAFGVANEPEGFHMPALYDFWRVLVGTVVTLIANYSFEFFLLPVWLKLDLKGGDDAELRMKYGLKSARCTYQTLYFTISTIWGYVVLKDTDWLPWWMGGMNNGNVDNMFKNNPFTPYPTAVLDYFLYTTGYHLGGLVKHIYENRESNDFLEMLMHHIATICLQFGSFLSNLMPVGATIAWVHDIA